MHVAHLGVYQYMYGSILWLLAFKLLHGSPTENMKVVMAGLRAHFRVHREKQSFQNIKLSMFQGEDHQYPNLKGRAAEVKHLSAALLHV